MGKICNAEAEHLGRRIAAHDSIRASLKERIPLQTQDRAVRAIEDSIE